MTRTRHRRSRALRGLNATELFYLRTGHLAIHFERDLPLDFAYQDGDGTWQIDDELAEIAYLDNEAVVESTIRPGFASWARRRYLGAVIEPIDDLYGHIVKEGAQL